MNNASITKEIDWFCYHVVAEKLLTREACIAVLEAIEGENLVPDLDLFVNVIKDNKLCSDDAKLDQFADMAKEEAKVFGFPSRSVLSAASGAAPQPAPHRPPAAATQEPPPAPAAAKPPAQAPATTATGGALPLPTDHKSAWLLDWPDLSQADKLDQNAAMQLLTDFLHKARENHCSDVHLSAGAVPFVRRYKKIHLIPGQDILSREASAAINYAPLSDAQRKRFEEHHDLDYCIQIEDDDRYRTNLLYQRLGPSGSYRVIDKSIRAISELGFREPEVIEKLTAYNQGLILLTGPAGCGKSSTLASLVDYINTNRHDHIISVEDPIEIIHPPKGCNVNQREISRHTKSFGNALRAALREDPDVIVIGEMRDLETIEMAIHASETGHLVIGTLHTNSAPETMNRILDVFPHNQQAQIRAMVAESLKAVVCQELLPNKNEDGVVLAAEILLGTLAVSNLIREGKTYQLLSTIQTNKHIGMVTMEQSYFDLYEDGKRSYDQTLPLIRNPDIIRQMQMIEAQRLKGGGRKGATPAPAPDPSPENAPAQEPAKPKRKWF